MPFDPNTGVFTGDFTEQYDAQIASGERDSADRGWAVMADRDSGSWEQQLRDYANQVGVSYDGSDLAGVQRNTSYAANAGMDPQTFINAQKAIYDQRATNVPGQEGNDNSGDANAQDRGRYVNASTPEGQYLKALREAQMRGPIQPVFGDIYGGGGGNSGGGGGGGGGGQMFQYPPYLSGADPSKYVGGPTGQADGTRPPGVSGTNPVPLDQLTEMLRRLLGGQGQGGAQGLEDLQAELRRLGVL